MSISFTTETFLMFLEFINFYFKLMSFFLILIINSVLPSTSTDQDENYCCKYYGNDPVDNGFFSR